jgi:multicomponent Na+:H+ antiporter subunit D
VIESLPALPLLVGAILVAVTRGPLRALVMLAAPLLGAWGVYQLEPGTVVEFQMMGLQLTPVRVDALSILFGYLFHLAAFIGVVYSLHIRDKMQDVAALAYAGSAVGAVFAGDLRRSKHSLATGMRYLVMQVGSGVLLLAGAIWYASAGNGLSFDFIGLDAPGGWLIFIAFGIKAGFPLLHGWLTDAYPEATPTGTVFLSAFTTKVAIYALARGFPGTDLLVLIGTLMTCFPIFFAVIENDLRRVLAYSMINQLGFMVVGIGIGTQLALNGAVAHAFTDVIFKGLLMMSMGAVLHVTGEMRGSELGGLYKKMPKTAILCMVGAASISAFPLFSGFVSKSMVVAAAIMEGHTVVWLALLFASAGVFHHAGIKIPFFAFFAHDSRHVDTAHEPPVNMLVAMTLGALLCVGIGSFPGLLYGLLPYDTGYWPFDVTHVLAQLQLLAFSALAFTWLKLAGIYPPELKSVHLDVDWLYRRVAPQAIRSALARLAPIDRTLRDQGRALVASSLSALARHHGSYGVLARSWPTGSMVFWVAVMLGLSLVLYYT